MTRVLVTAARGLAGAPLAALLSARPGVEAVGGSSSPTARLPDGVRPVALSWDDPSGWAAALDGVDALHLVRPDRADAPELAAALLERAPEAARVTLVSELHADYPDLDHWARRVEDAVRESGRRWTILRPGWFMQVFTDPRYYRDELVESSALSFAAGGASVAWIDARDIAAVAERALLDDDLIGSVLELTGPESLTLPRTVGVLSLGTGRHVEHRDVSVAEAAGDAPGFLTELAAATFRRVQAGAFAEVTDVVERVTGTPARSLEQFVADHRTLLRPAPPTG